MVRSIPYYWGVSAAGLLLTAVLLPLAAPGAAQQPTAALAGRVVDHQTRAPITRAQVALLGVRRQTESDSTGRFHHDDLKAGTYLLQIRAIGYEVSTWMVRLDTGEVLTQDFDLNPVLYTLAPVTGEAARGPMARRLREFERRRADGRGVFISEDDIRRTEAATLSELLRTAAGVQVVCNSAGCVARMTRAATGFCQPDFVVDGFPANLSTNANLPTVGIVAVEVYRSPNEAPIEFLRTDGVCGVIVIWTRSSPNP